MELDDLNDWLIHTHDERDDAQDSLQLKEKELREASKTITDKDRILAQMREQLSRNTDLDDDEIECGFTTKEAIDDGGYQLS